MMDEEKEETDPLDEIIARAIRYAVWGHERYHVIEATDGTLDVVPVAVYKRLQMQGKILATAIPDGTVRR